MLSEDAIRESSRDSTYQELLSFVVREKREKRRIPTNLLVLSRPRHSAFTLLFRHCSSEAREHRQARLISLT